MKFRLYPWQKRLIDLFEQKRQAVTSLPRQPGKVTLWKFLKAIERQERLKTMNVKIETRGKKQVLLIEAEINEATSKSGKTTLLVSSKGNLATSAQYKDKPVIVGLNAYVKKD